MIQYIILALLRWLLMIAIRLPMFFIGLFVVPIALRWRYEDTTYQQKQPITWHDWRYIRLPKWAWPWDNTHDGAMGEPHGKFWLREARSFLKTDYWKMWWWLAVRNPTNNLTRHTHFFAYHAGHAHTRLLAGDPVVHDNNQHYGWQFLCAYRGPYRYYGFYLVKRLSKKWFVSMRLGNKISPTDRYGTRFHDNVGAWVGSTFRPFRFRRIK